MQSHDFTDVNSTVYGRPIKLKNTSKTGSKQIMGAESMISQFLNVKTTYREHLTAMTDGDRHAARYYCKDDVAYIFSVEIMRAIVNAIDSYKKTDASSKGCVVFFQGLRKSPVDPTNLTKGFEFGRPTLIATAYVQDPHTNELQYIQVHDTDLKADGPIDAFEHPGDGTGGTISRAAKPQGNSPVVYRNCEDNDTELCDTDFSINKSIGVQQLEGWRF